MLTPLPGQEDSATDILWWNLLFAQRRARAGMNGTDPQTNAAASAPTWLSRTSALLSGNRSERHMMTTAGKNLPAHHSSTGHCPAP
uniref:hypothetical protein n=1 Tax=Rhodococcus erythropolis TaxID=1833 RepID=UPI000BB37E4A|nr:hypothetical protein [Rhodococcus erythropolis]